MYTHDKHAHRILSELRNSNQYAHSFLIHFIHILQTCLIEDPVIDQIIYAIYNVHAYLVTRFTSTMKL